MVIDTPPTVSDRDRKRMVRLLAELGVGYGPGRTLPHRHLAEELGVSRFHWSKIANARLPAYGQDANNRWPTWASFEQDVRAAVERLRA